MALRLTQDQYQSEELIQEMWVIAIKKLGGFEWRSELKTWLIGILINLSRAKRKEKGFLEITEDVSVGSSVELSFANSHDLEKAISHLPPGYRQIIILHDIEGYKHREIAELLDVTEGTCKSQLFHARKALREYLSEDTTKGTKHG